MKWNPEIWQEHVSTCLVKHDYCYTALQINLPHSPINSQFWMLLITRLRTHIKSHFFFYFDMKGACQQIIWFSVSTHCSPSYAFATKWTALVCMDNSLKMILILRTKTAASKNHLSAIFVFTRRGETKEFLPGTRPEIQMMAQQRKDCEETCDYSDAFAAIKQEGFEMREKLGDCSQLSLSLI